MLAHICNMKFQVGDDIVVAHSNEEGKVVDIISDDMVMVEVRGVQFPAYLDQLDFPYFKRFTAKKLVPEKKEKTIVDNVAKETKPINNLKEADGVWLSLIPKFVLDDFNDEVVDSFKLYLVNHSPYDLHFLYKQMLNDGRDFELTNDVKAQKDFYLHDMDFEDLNEKPSFVVTFSLPKAIKNLADSFDVVLKLKSKQVFKQVELLKEKNEPTIAYQLFATYPDKSQVATEDELSTSATGNLDLSKLASKGFNIKYSADKIREHLPKARTVVDLHIEKLVDSWKNMSNLEILSIQLKEFEKWYELAINNRQSNLIIIHGVGKGKLKEEIHQLLKYKSEVKSFVNQYDPRFGYGATEIIFK